MGKEGNLTEESVPNRGSKLGLRAVPSEAGALLLLDGRYSPPTREETVRSGDFCSFPGREVGFAAGLPALESACLTDSAEGPGHPGHQAWRAARRCNGGVPGPASQLPCHTDG